MYDSAWFRRKTREYAPHFFRKEHLRGLELWLAWWVSRYRTKVRYGGELTSLYQVAVDVIECLDTPAPRELGGGEPAIVYSPKNHNGLPIDPVKLASIVRYSDRKALDEHARLPADAEDPTPL